MTSLTEVSHAGAPHDLTWFLWVLRGYTRHRVLRGVACYNAPDAGGQRPKEKEKENKVGKEKERKDKEEELTDSWKTPEENKSGIVWVKKRDTKRWFGVTILLVGKQPTCTGNTLANVSKGAQVGLLGLMAMLP